ncbi:hypothetical protein [Seleniivibrio woodruffii]|uniref:Uncharacterized protein n=1 Tax=Seleniivibrio woodruffii TaxID=1078050 RepID=A0A4V2PRD1_9BACT|nr:hypothetical protein [Seleniivibrio woodruffii]TCK58381.1 hypothetical protein C8D98_2582 [Seleniivibrio woodruffii]TVZ36754.1 hypothetical protein OF66_2391 [Seleniivibrio woodruffii]
MQRINIEQLIELLKSLNQEQVDEKNTPPIGPDDNDVPGRYKTIGGFKVISKSSQKKARERHRQHRQTLKTRKGIANYVGSPIRENPSVQNRGGKAGKIAKRGGKAIPSYKYHNLNAYSKKKLLDSIIKHLDIGCAVQSRDIPVEIEVRLNEKTLTVTNPCDGTKTLYHIIKGMLRKI